MSAYTLNSTGAEIDRIHGSAYESVANMNALGLITTSGDKVSDNKIVMVEDIGDGTSGEYEWDGTSWVVHEIDTVVLSDGAIIKSANGNIELDLTSEGDDQGIIFKGGQLEVQDSEIIAGKDSYPVQYAFQYDTANESGTTIIGATDVTTILQSDESSSVNLFAVNTSDQILLIGADERFYGVKMKYDSLGVLEPGNVIGEYLNTSEIWTEQRFMVTNADCCDSAGYELASFEKEHVRFGQSLNPNYVLDFTPLTLTINGVTYADKYWSRLRLTSTITELPVVQQIKEHPSRIELNSGGALEFFGQSMGKFTLQSGIKKFINNAESSPSNESVKYFNSSVDGDGISAGYLDNEFQNGTIDSTIIEQSFLESLDTSTPLLLAISYYPMSSVGGNLELVVDYSQITDDFEYGTSSLPEGTVSVIQIIDANTEDIRKTIYLEVPINRVSSTGGAVVMALQRDARTTNLNDTYEGNIALTDFRLIGRRWKV